jgi:hypothetical protein
MAIIISALNVIKIITSIISICLIKNFGKKYKEENNYINEEQTSIKEKNDESINNKKNNESNTNYKLQTELDGLNLSENKDKNKEDIINNNISNYPMDTIEYNKDIDNAQEEVETNQENNAQSFSVQNSSANPENETNK